MKNVIRSTCLSILAALSFGATAVPVIVEESLSATDATFRAPDSLTVVGRDLHFYDVIPLHVTVGGNFVLQTTFDIYSPLILIDPMLALYAGNFNPATPLANILAFNDDTAGPFSYINVPLIAETDYFLVVTSFYNIRGEASAVGLYTIQMESATGDGEVVLGQFIPGATLVPEPGSLALLGLGLAGLAAIRKRKQA